MSATRTTGIRLTWWAARMLGSKSARPFSKSTSERISIAKGPRTSRGLSVKTQNVTLNNGHLYLNSLPLIPQSETKFESTGAITEFFLDANGKVTHLDLGLTEGAA